MTLCFFISDMHGNKNRFEKLFERIGFEKPEIVFFGGDIFPNPYSQEWADKDFFNGFLVERLTELKKRLKDEYPKVFIILGNDDGKSDEKSMIKFEKTGIWKYIHNKKVSFKEYTVYGYSYIPPSPFMLKDWEKYDVSRYVDPGCVSPEEGIRTVKVENNIIKYSTIKKDLEQFITDNDLSKTIILFHSPPYKTKLDRLDLNGKMIDQVLLDVHVGSIAIKEFIEEREPYLTLHGHIHESSTVTGSYMERINNTVALNAAYEKDGLSLIRFNLEDITTISREII